MHDGHGCIRQINFRFCRLVLHVSHVWKYDAILCIACIFLCMHEVKVASSEGYPCKPSWTATVIHECAQLAQPWPDLEVPNPQRWSQDSAHERPLLDSDQISSQVGLAWPYYMIRYSISTSILDMYMLQCCKSMLSHLQWLLLSYVQYDLAILCLSPLCFSCQELLHIVLSTSLQLVR